MKVVLWIVFAFAVAMLLLNLTGIQLSPGQTTAKSQIQAFSRHSQSHKVTQTSKPASTAEVVQYAAGGIFLLALAWWLSGTPRVLAGVSIPTAGYLAYVQTLADPTADQRTASAVIGLFLAIATGLSQLRQK
jgi:hypothetical protein